MKINYIENEEMRHEYDAQPGSNVSENFGHIIDEKNSRGEKVMGARINNSVKALYHEVTEGDEIELIDIYSEDGRQIYIRTLLYILCKAIFELYPKTKVTVEYQLLNAMSINIKNLEITDEITNAIENRMREIVESNLEIRKVRMKKSEAEEFYSNNKTLRGILQKDHKQRDEVTLYFCGEYFNYFYGVMPPKTGIIDVFKVQKYKNGLIVRYPSREDSSKVGHFEDRSILHYSLREYDDIYRLLKTSTAWQLNQKLKRAPKDVVLLSEALHESKMFELVNNITEKDNIKMILIAGPTSSGKTTFSSKLATALRIKGLKPVTISVDNYFKDREETPLDENGEYDFESINAIDLELFNRDIENLIEGKTIEMPEFNFKEGIKEYGGTKMCLKKDEILIMEGIHCLNPILTKKINDKFKYKIYISALTVLNLDYFNRISTTDTRLIRRIVRDHHNRGYSAQDTIALWDSVVRGERKNIFPYQEESDFMFNSSVIYELSAIKKHVVPLLKEIPDDAREFSTASRLLELLQYFVDVEDDIIPNNALIREFIGGSIYSDMEIENESCIDKEDMEDLENI